ncbi:MAG TPA: hypothetical protein VG147_02135 [Solirubrobacteraceae bacterium]|jgi:hypothetical protein|nr:hypothetical protein [Solirubrobacteraceae bacterium]
MRVKVALGVGLALIALAFLLTLAHTPLTVARGGVVPERTVVSTARPASACQGGETLPRGTTALRLSLTAALGPRVSARVLSGSRMVAHGTTGAGWSDASVTVAVQPLSHTVAPVTVCLAMTQMNGKVAMRGSPTSPAQGATSGGERLPGRMDIEYLRPGGSSWWSQATAVARRLGLGHAASGAWNALLVMALAASCIALSSWLVVKELR